MMWLSGLRPLWLDEILQLIGTRSYSGHALLQFVRQAPGAAPLGYFIQHWAITIFGYSAYSARMSSELCSALACIALISIAKQLGIPGRWMLMFIWMCLPLQLRYALEARPYSQGLLLTAVETACFLRILTRPTVSNGLIYAASVALGLYSAPHSLFLQMGYLTWLISTSPRDRQTIYAGAAIAVAGALFLPWYLTSAPYWKDAVSSNHAGLEISAKFPLLLIRELTGGGYVCSLALIVLVTLGCLSPTLSRSLKACLVSGIVSSLFCAIVSDAVFGYFFAIRQVMFIIVPLIVLAASGLSPVMKNGTGLLAKGTVTVLIVSSLMQDVRYFMDRSENWAAGAKAIQDAASAGACINFATADDLGLYQFFDTSLAETNCMASQVKNVIAVPYTRYTRLDRLQYLTDELSRHGFVKIRLIKSGGTTVVFYWAKSGKPVQ